MRLCREIATRSFAAGPEPVYIGGPDLDPHPRRRTTHAAPNPCPRAPSHLARYQDGQDGPTIAQALGLPTRTVRHLLSRFRRGGPGSLSPSYDRCGAATPKPAESLVQIALGLRRQHPTWGAGLIHVMLRRQLPDTSLPSVRTLQRWFRSADLCPAPVGRRTATDSRRARRPHEAWQMDAAELVKLRTGQLVSWLRIVDECSGAVLQTAVFPRGYWAQVPPRETQRNCVWPSAAGAGRSGCG